MAYKTIQLRRDTSANWANNNPLLAAGEAGLETDTGQLKTGTGAANWNSLPYIVDQGLAAYSWQKAVISTSNTPPLGPGAGARYLVGSSPTDDFVGHTSDVATWSGSGWSFHTPAVGDMFWHAADGKYYYWYASAWTEWAGGGSSGIDTSVLLNQLILGIRVLRIGTVPIQTLVDEVLDGFADSTGVDATASTGEAYNATADTYSLAANTSWSQTLNTQAGSYGGYSCRVVVSAATLSTSGAYCRVVLQATSSASASFTHVSIVEQASGANGTTTPTEFLFSGSSGGTAAAGQTLTSDWLEYALDETKAYLVVVDVASGSQPLQHANAGSLYYKSATASWDQQTVSGFSSAAQTWFVTSLTVADTLDMSLVSEDTTAASTVTKAYAVFVAGLTGTPMLDTDILGYVSGDDGVHWDQVALTLLASYSATAGVYGGSVSLTTSSGTAIRWKFETANNTPAVLYGAAVSWE